MPESEQNLSSIPSDDQAALIAGPQHVQSPNQLIQLSDQQLAKLQSELDVVQGNMRVLSEMLAYLTSPEQASNQQPDPADIELLTVKIVYKVISKITIYGNKPEIKTIFFDFVFLGTP